MLPTFHPSFLVSSVFDVYLSLSEHALCCLRFVCTDRDQRLLNTNTLVYRSESTFVFYTLTAGREYCRYLSVCERYRFAVMFALLPPLLMDTHTHTQTTINTQNNHRLLSHLIESKAQPPSVVLSEIVFLLEVLLQQAGEASHATGSLVVDTEERLDRSWNWNQRCV